MWVQSEKDTARIVLQSKSKQWLCEANYIVTICLETYTKEPPVFRSFLVAPPGIEPGF
jgi:hypothetical protein